jgi:hypothetical protein
MKTKMKKYQDGGPKKVTTVSNSGNYKTITKNNTEPTTKVRRTVKGVLKNAPTVREAKEARLSESTPIIKRNSQGNLETVGEKRYPNYVTSGMGDFKKNGGTVKKMKTGGMVNANANLKATATAGSKGVKSGVNPKAAASKVAKGRVGGTSVAPKAAMPKAIGSTKKYQDGGPTGNSPENQIKRSMIKSAFNNARNTTKARSGKPVGKI